MAPYPATRPASLSTPASQIGFHHRWILAYIPEAAFRNFDAVVEHDDALADALNQSHVMLDQRNGNPELADAPDIVHQLALLCWVHSSGRFVEQHQLGLRGKCTRDLEASAIRIGQGVRDVLRTREQPIAKEREQLVRTLRRAPPFRLDAGALQHNAGKPCMRATV